MLLKTLVILKPSCIQRGIAGEIISRFEKKGLKIIGMKLSLIDSATANLHYEEHKGKPYFDSLVNYITSGPVILMVVEGLDAISMTRKLCGSTLALDAEPGTIRGDYAMRTQRNIIHSSDSEKSAEREISIFFSKTELIEYERNFEVWI